MDPLYYTLPLPATSNRKYNFYYRWQNTSLSITTTLEDATIAFILNFSKLCYHLVKSGNIKIAAIMQEEGTLHFPDLGEVTIDQVQIKIKKMKKALIYF